METVDIVIIGAGVVGLAVAERLSRHDLEIVLVERHDGFGRETSSRNSEVIHAGLYYAEDLLRTRLGVRGNPLLYELCAAQGIAHRRTGKIVVAAEEADLPQLHRIKAQAETNGVADLSLLTQKQISDLEPHVHGVEGLYSPNSGIIDSHQLMKYLETTAKSRGVTVAYNCEVVAVVKSNTGYKVEIQDTDGQPLSLTTETVVNAAGLGADQIAASVGIDIDAAGYRINPCKGDYFSVANRYRGYLNRLIYPMPSPLNLGIHTRLNLDGSFKIGPDSYYVDSIHYEVDPAKAPEFLAKVIKFLPFLNLSDLSPDMSGIRPKLYRKGEPFRDFVIKEEGEAYPGLINLIGIESPGLTACLTIAERVATLLS